MLKYPKIPEFRKLIEELALYSQLKHEHGAKRIAPILARAERDLKSALRDLKQLPVDRDMAEREPNSLPAIRALRPRGPRRLWQSFDRETYLSRLEGALMGRFAGCTLGAPVEFWTIERMEDLAKENEQSFPPTEYWTYVPGPYETRYGTSARYLYTRDGMNGVPVDDDIVYTLLGLLVVEAYGPEFNIDQIGDAWLRFLPMACTAEEVALNNLRKGVRAGKAGEKENPYCEWIGADIRSDPWGYMAPGLPEKAAEMAYRDAFLSHRRNGIHGEMFFSATQSAAFAVDNPVDALKIGLTEIPKDCKLAADVRWALRVGNRIKNYRDARRAVDERFKGMHPVHTNNNACLTIFGLMIGGTDVTRVLSETVAMGMDNDCTTATAGSIVGAIVGKKGVPKHWYKRFNNTVHSYLINRKKFKITALIKRFTRQAERVFDACDY